MSREEFQQAYAEIQTTTDPRRYAYLKWIGYQMWKIFDYESGLDAINKDERECREYRGSDRSSINDAKRDIAKRDALGKPVEFPLKRGLFAKDINE